MLFTVEHRDRWLKTTAVHTTSTRAKTKHCGGLTCGAKTPNGSHLISSGRPDAGRPLRVLDQRPEGPHSFPPALLTVLHRTSYPVLLRSTPQRNHCCRRRVLLERYRTLLHGRLLWPPAAAVVRGRLLLPRFAAVARDRLLRPLAAVAVAVVVVVAGSALSDLPASSSCQPSCP